MFHVEQARNKEVVFEIASQEAVKQLHTGGWTSPHGVKNTDDRLVWGWLCVSTKNGQAYYDTDRDWITEEAIERAARKHNASGKKAIVFVNHDRQSVKGEVYNMVPHTSDLQRQFNMTCDKTGMMVSVLIHDAQLMERVKSGELRSFSVGFRWQLKDTTTIEKTRHAIGEKERYTIIHDMDIIDVSLVQDPAQVGADVLAIKSKEMHMPHEVLQAALPQTEQVMESTKEAKPKPEMKEEDMPDDEKMGGSETDRILGGMHAMFSEMKGSISAMGDRMSKMEEAIGGKSAVPAPVAPFAAASLPGQGPVTNALEARILGNRVSDPHIPAQGGTEAKAQSPLDIYEQHVARQIERDPKITMKQILSGLKGNRTGRRLVRDAFSYRVAEAIKESKSYNFGEQILKTKETV